MFDGNQKLFNFLLYCCPVYFYLNFYLLFCLTTEVFLQAPSHMQQELMPVHPSVCPHVSGWFPLDEYSWSLVLGKFLENLNLQIWLQLDKNIGHFTCSPKSVYIVDRGPKYFVARQQRRGTHCYVSMATVNTDSCM